MFIYADSPDVRERRIEAEKIETAEGRIKSACVGIPNPRKVSEERKGYGLKLFQFTPGGCCMCDDLAGTVARWLEHGLLSDARFGQAGYQSDPQFYSSATSQVIVFLQGGWDA